MTWRRGFSPRRAKSTSVSFFNDFGTHEGGHPLLSSDTESDKQSQRHSSPRIFQRQLFLDSGVLAPLVFLGRRWSCDRFLGRWCSWNSDGILWDGGVLWDSDALGRWCSWDDGALGRWWYCLKCFTGMGITLYGWKYLMSFFQVLHRTHVSVRSFGLQTLKLSPRILPSI